MKSKDEFKGLILSSHADMWTWSMTYRREHISQQFKKNNNEPINPLQFEQNGDMSMSKSTPELCITYTKEET